MLYSVPYLALTQLDSTENSAKVNRNSNGLQEDSQKGKKGMQMAGLYFFPFLTCILGPKPSVLENDPTPGGNLFKRLDSLQAREHIDIEPGNTLVAVYGDSW